MDTYFSSNHFQIRDIFACDLLGPLQCSLQHFGHVHCFKDAVSFSEYIHYLNCIGYTPQMYYFKQENSVVRKPPIEVSWFAKLPFHFALEYYLFENINSNPIQISIIGFLNDHVGHLVVFWNLGSIYYYCPYIKCCFYHRFAMEIWDHNYSPLGITTHLFLSFMYEFPQLIDIVE